MRLCLLAAFVAVVLSSSDHERRKRWAELPSELAVGADPSKTLVFVSAVWRHGDRSPTDRGAGDALKEEDWDFGGGGYGQLSPLGMQQHFTLGRSLRTRFIDTKFLKPSYSAKEIYVRATDVNRTLVSAMSNMAGMYSGLGNAVFRPGIDFPDQLAGWPAGLVPVPIHTDVRPGDYIANPDAACARQKQLWTLVQQTKEYKNYENNHFTKATLDFIANQTGETITFDNIWKTRDAMLIEGMHFSANVSTWYPWYTEDVKRRVDEIDDKNIDFQNGIFDNGVTDSGVDLTIEIPKIRGGSLIKEIYQEADGVIDCYKNITLGLPGRCHPDDHYYQNLKYHVISAHDTTVTAYLTVLGAKAHVVKPGGYPHYASTVLTEFYYDNTANKPVFKVLFYMGDVNTTIHGDPFVVITSLVEGCTLGQEYCDVAALEKLVAKYTPGNIHTLCETPPAGFSTLPPSSTPPSSAPPVTGSTDSSSSSVPTTTPAPPPTTSSAPALLALLPSALILARQRII